MNNSIKIGLGLLAGGTLVLAVQLLRKNKNKLKSFTALDGNSYQKDKMYRTSEGDIFKNGRKMHFETPELLSQANRHIDTYQNNINLYNANQSVRNTNYHHRGVRNH